MSESAADLQKQFDSVSDYCDIWRLKVNVEKSKIVVFSQGRTPNNLKFNVNYISKLRTLYDSLT
jgi:hypothetical protein